eukprot:gnl/TRDRNA2_/TRDRNA2_161399_c0_seq2.p1 gnl/TRDRNA2_/TRDRNA2_161399_c0~~gnl/TRDRNA2_/TRDRNA2_161399_c0_seq2.p1  ORF type:complete len:312 (-),score=44.80 gnl/TRDRNA2_/TRDRNA2_161399_c0_seq2:334-1269(-)
MRARCCIFVICPFALIAQDSVQELAAGKTARDLRATGKLDHRRSDKLIDGLWEICPRGHTSLESAMVAKTSPAKVAGSAQLLPPARFMMHSSPSLPATSPLLRLGQRRSLISSCFPSTWAVPSRHKSPGVAKLAVRSAAEASTSDDPAVQAAELATFALGSFWDLQYEYDDAEFPGIVSTTVGYTGGQSENPTYDSVSRGGDHKEALRIKFDSRKTEYKELLDMFWKQYQDAGKKVKLKRAVLWYHSEEQRKSIEDSISKYSAKAGSTPEVDVLPASKWYDAEEYNQKYYWKEENDYEPFFDENDTVDLDR